MHSGEWLIESKSLKLYLAAFRNHGAFHEDCTVAIGRRIAETAEPRWLRIGGYWFPRGGIPIDIFWQSGPPPEGLWLPDQGSRALSWTGLRPALSNSRPKISGSGPAITSLERRAALIEEAVRAGIQMSKRED